MRFYKLMEFAMPRDAIARQRRVNHLTFLVSIFIIINNITAQTWHSLDQGLENSVTVLERDAKDSVLYIAGEFESWNGNAINKIISWDGNELYALEPSYKPVGGSIIDIVEYNNAIFVSGSSDITTTIISKWGNEVWRPVPDTANYLQGLIVENSVVYKGNLFLTGILMFNSGNWNIGTYDGSGMSVIGNGVTKNGWVASSKVFKDRLYYCGANIQIDTTYLGNVCYWDGNSFNNANILAESCEILCVESFRDTLYAGSKCGNLYKLDGITWKLVAQASGGIYSLKSLDSLLYVGGVFTFINGIPNNRIASYDGFEFDQLGSGVNGPVYCISDYKDNLYVGGEFDKAGNVDVLNIAIWGINVGYKEIVKSEKLNIYPNPCKDKLYFDIEESGYSEIVDGKIVNHLGQTIIEMGSVLIGPDYIDVSTLTNGVYCCQLISSNGKTFQGRFIKE